MSTSSPLIDMTLLRIYPFEILIYSKISIRSCFVCAIDDAITAEMYGNAWNLLLIDPMPPLRRVHVSVSVSIVHVPK